MKKILFISSSRTTLTTFLKPLIIQLSEEYDVYTVGQERIDGVKYISTPFLRKPSFSDFRTLLILIYRFRTLRPNMIVSITPKAGLISMLAGLLTNTPVRWHIFTGQVWANKTGLYREMLKGLDLLTFKAATFRTCDGIGQQKFLVDQWGLPTNSLIVLGPGSILGVETQPIKINSDIEQIQNILIVARINRDKGLEHLIEIAKIAPQYNYYVVGAIEDKALASLLEENNINLLGYVQNMKDVYLKDMHLVISFSQREGFNLSLIEAMSFGIPVVASNIYGHKGTISTNKGGFFYNSLEEIPYLIETISLDYKFHSRNAINWSFHFNRTEIINLYENEIKRLIN